MKNMIRVAIGVVVIAVTACAPAAPPLAEDPTPQGLENGSFTAELNGFTIHYEIHGQGPVLMVLTNSWGLSTEGLRGLLESLEDGSTVDLAKILDLGLASMHTKLLKVLGNGALTKKLTVRAQKCSKSAVEKITAAGGSFVALDAQGREMTGAAEA